MEVNTFNLDTILLVSIISTIVSIVLLCVALSIKETFKNKYLDYFMAFMRPILQSLTLLVTGVSLIIMLSSFAIREDTKLVEPVYSYKIQDFSLESVRAVSGGITTKYKIVSVVGLDGKLETFNVLNVLINENCNTSSVEYYDKMWFNEHFYINKETVVVNLDRSLTADELKAVEESNK